MKLKKIVLSVSTLLLIGGNTYAADVVGSGNISTGSMEVSSILSPGCHLSTTNFGFGNLLPNFVNGNTYSTARLLITCTKTTPYDISLDTGYSNDYSKRTMVGSLPGNNDRLSYNVYPTLPVGSIIGDGTSGTIVISEIGRGEVTIKNIYAKIYPQTYITPDTYRDVLTIKLTY